MAALTTAQKAPVTVTDYAGNAVPLNSVQVSVDPSGAISWDAPNGVLEVIGQKAGTGTLTVAYNGAVGELVVDVTDAPLVITMGEPVSKLA